jgi:hypothetical protein
MTTFDICIAPKGDGRQTRRRSLGVRQGNGVELPWFNHLALRDGTLVSTSSTYVFIAMRSSPWSWLVKFRGARLNGQNDTRIPCTDLAKIEEKPDASSY